MHAMMCSIGLPIRRYVVQAGEFEILVATDVAGRGLDIADVALVLNYDLPTVIWQRVVSMLC